MLPAILILLMAAPVFGAGTRLKELASLEGVRDNQLMGYGLVVGLNGTGDKRQTVFSAQALSNILQRMGISVNPTAILVRNMAAVMVTATLPPFAQPGTKIDITAAAIGDSTNLQGGMLLLTPLNGADGKVYAAAQGNILTGGFSAGGRGNSQTVNHPTVGRIPSGAIVEQAPPSVAPGSKLKLQLHQSDFTTAAKVVSALNNHFGGETPVARALSSAVVAIDLPEQWASRPVEFVAEMENLTVEADRKERIVINEKTGTIVLGKDVKISPVAIIHGALNVEVRTAFDVSQPEPLSAGKTAVIPQTNIGASEEKAKHLVLDKGATIEQLVRALQAIGSTPRDVIAVLENMKSAGALDADIEVI
ncbi:MAG: flagellar basal body P-ring protein FlgI [Bryobacterales bacterium]|nr:flagellar basal body P-ring protein FlgI [Bryobacterales bacterium]MBV9400139.1 flagellar basal body P-ring protein FlgI [Bryobacterales bacterium]